MKIYAVWKNYQNKIELASVEVEETERTYRCDRNAAGGAFRYGKVFDKDKCDLTPLAAVERFCRQIAEERRVLAERLRHTDDLLSQACRLEVEIRGQ